jgi:cell division protease FtsH
MGHALVAMTLTGSDPVHKVSIIPRGIGSLGYTIQRPIEDRYLMTLAELEDKMAVLLGGRAAEVLIYGTLSTGAADDLSRATEIARSIVTRYGMDAVLGQMTYDQEPALLSPGRFAQAHERGYSEETAREIDCAVRKLIAQASARAYGVLARRRSTLEIGARRLLQQETLSAGELRDLLLGGAATRWRREAQAREFDQRAIERGENEGMRDHPEWAAA